MEFGAKEILIALGVLVLIAIVLDFIKRMRAARYENIRMPRRKRPVFEGDEPVDEYGSELPGGGARVVAYRNLDQQAPESEPEAEVAEAPVEPKPTPEPEPATVEKEPVHRATGKTGEPQQASLDLAGSQAGDAGSDSSGEVIVMHLMATSGHQFDGGLLKKTFLENGLRFGAMKIFHRHQQTSGSGPVLFSVANSVNPGTFDLISMDEFATPGVTLFFACDNVDDPAEALSVMLDTAQTMAVELEGELKDETRSVLTKQTIEHYRQKVADHLRTRLSHH